MKNKLKLRFIGFFNKHSLFQTFVPLQEPYILKPGLILFRPSFGTMPVKKIIGKIDARPSQ